MFENTRKKLSLDRFDTEYLPAFESKLFFEGAKRDRQFLNFIVLLALATVIATYGVITDSTATVIGAMIIAPLMTPIMASGAAVSMGSSTRAIKSLTLVALGVISVIVLSILLTAIVPSQLISVTQNSQIASRVHPGLLDLFVALAAGAAGAFAIGRQEIADSLAGVAIAISLVPPLCVVGITLFIGGFAASAGAFLLFLTNFMAILIAGIAMFGVMGLPKVVRMEMNDETRKKAMEAIILASVVLVVILAFTSYNAYITTNNQVVAGDTVKTWLGPAPYEIQSVTITGSIVGVTLVGDGPLPPVDTLSAMMEQKFGQKMIIVLRTIPQKSVTYPSALVGLAGNN
jgi:uncharacterized hydrophobic protein (TIGR00271 family)